MDYINLKHYIFREDPDTVFSKSMKVPLGIWNDLYKRHKFWDYKHEDLVEWFELKQKQPISKKTMYRWVIRQELYNDAQRAIQAGAEKVTIEYFTRNKEYATKYKI